MKQRQQGQIMAMFGLSLLGIVALVSLVVDGGNIYIQRRTAQNAADAAALAGSRALLNARVSPDVTIAAEICKYAMSNTFGVQPTPTAYFIGMDGVTNQGAIVLPTTCTGTASDAVSNAIPTGSFAVAGIHVDAQIVFSTFVPRIIGIASMTAQASATSQVGAASGINALDAPVAGCGVQMDTGSTSTISNIFVGGIPPTIDYATWTGTTFILQSSQLDKYSPHPPCPIYNSGNGDWKGTISGTGTIGLPSSQPTVNGNSAASLDTACTSAGMADPTGPSPNNICYLAIPITDGSNPQTLPGVAHVVALACMQVTGTFTGNDLWKGTVVDPGKCGASSIYTYSYNWTWAPGSYTFARVALTH